MTPNSRTAKREKEIHAQVKIATCKSDTFWARKQFAHVQRCGVIAQTGPCILTV